MADIQYDPACMDCRHDAVKDPAGTTWQCYPHVHAERDALRLALETATRELETYQAEHEGCIEIWRKECTTVKAEQDNLYDRAKTMSRMLDAIEGVATGQPGEIPTAVEEGWSTALGAVMAIICERDEARVALEKSRRTIYFTWRDVEACREGLSISADIKGDTLEEVVRFLLNERADLLSKAAPPADAATEAVRLLREVASAGVEFEDDRISYTSVQIDRETWASVRAYVAALSRPAPPADAAREAVRKPRYGDTCRAACGAPARYLHDGLCLWVSSMDNEPMVGLSGGALAKGSHVLPSDEMLASAAAGLRAKTVPSPAPAPSAKEGRT